MPLDEINKGFDKTNDPALAHRVHEQSDYDPWNASVKTREQEIVVPFEEEKWKEVKKGLNPTQKRRVAILIGVVVAAIFLSLAFWGYNWWKKNAFHQEKVAISIEGPKEVDNTEITRYIIHYKNSNLVPLKNMEINLQYPENFQPSDTVNLKILSTTSSKFFVPDIKANSEGSVDLNGVFYAPKDYPVILHATLSYTPSNGASKLSNDIQQGVVVTKSPLTLNISAPQNATDGNSVEYVIDYKSLDVRLLSNTQIRVDFPESFEYLGAQPLPSERSSYWYVGNLEPNQSGQIRIQGKMHGSAGEAKSITVSLGRIDEEGKYSVYNKREATTQITIPVLSIVQSLAKGNNNVVNPGEALSYIILYRNNGNIGLRDVIITAQLQGNILDLSALELGKGSFDNKTSVITWKASDFPPLANVNPGQEGRLTFSVPVKKIIPITGPNDKNFEIKTIAKIDSPDIPTPINSNKVISSNTLDLKLASKVMFNTTGFYNDAIIKNSGPTPLEVGKETSLTLHWSIANVSNDLVNARVTSSLPSGVQWKGVIVPDDKKISFNARTNQIIWDAGNIEAGVGVISPAKSVAFQVSVVPQPNQNGIAIPLINESNFTATDTFVTQDVNLKSPQRSTELPEDKDLSGDSGRVMATP